MKSVKVGRSFSARINDREVWEKISFELDEGDLSPEDQQRPSEIKALLLQYKGEYMMVETSLRFGLLTEDQAQQQRLSLKALVSNLREAS